ncbi:uncharacterized protein LOC143211529 isoform X3 [Lasioglossum baleicum]|uniref:uncharacterized protein LOC143211529 isoform X3 n=1 Tax=Lasioglossum baleicum TaxID=434251 RepID=UPI003FCD0E5D
MPHKNGNLIVFLLKAMSSKLSRFPSHLCTRPVHVVDPQKSLVSSYIVSNCRHNIQGVPLAHNAHANRQTDHRDSRPGSDQNEVSISIIPTSEFFPSHRKMFVIASQPAVDHLSEYMYQRRT